ncbi:hypothetical protein cyc_02937 [Cyclospora cayetanensis]|uniref:Uncharacterized protein n=1 Tax=Cyclospora cayetanensis TaxID=88456 RepID=A0A1D3D7S2_9EIME|nr:hypothetical protein cyc_02937 [Cyclospora cayetanensis]
MSLPMRNSTLRQTLLLGAASAMLTLPEAFGRGVYGRQVMDFSEMPILRFTCYPLPLSVQHFHVLLWEQRLEKYDMKVPQQQRPRKLLEKRSPDIREDSAYKRLPNKKTLMSCHSRARTEKRLRTYGSRRGACGRSGE